MMFGRLTKKIYQCFKANKYQISIKQKSEIINKCFKKMDQISFEGKIKKKENKF